nr:hypothetical protein Iba_chr15aCG14950 [Ipomoea batatas]GME18887.1 hypothetical protein Iba_scaffold21539CG0280 [Ipomoea batatas]
MATQGKACVHNKSSAASSSAINPKVPIDDVSFQKLMSSWGISHTDIHTVSHSSSSNTCISFCHHSNKLPIINPPILILIHFSDYIFKENICHVMFYTSLLELVNCNITTSILVKILKCCNKMFFTF